MATTTGKWCTSRTIRTTAAYSQRRSQESSHAVQHWHALTTFRTSTWPPTVTWWWLKCCRMSCSSSPRPVSTPQRQRRRIRGNKVAPQVPDAWDKIQFMQTHRREPLTRCGKRHSTSGNDAAGCQVATKVLRSIDNFRPHEDGNPTRFR